MSTPAARPLLRLFPVLLLNLTAFGVSIPVVPALARELGATGAMVGAIFALQAIGQLIMAPLWGKLSDRIGRKPVLALTIFGAAMADLLTATSTSLVFLFLARFAAGLCAGNVATASALVSDATEAHNRSRGMAIIGICFGLGFTMGPGLGALASTWGAPGVGPLGRGLPFVVAASINLIAALLAVVLLREPSGDIEERARRRMARRPTGLRELMRRPGVVVMGVFFTVLTVGVTIQETTFFLYANARYGFDEAQVGVLFAGMGLLSALVQGGIGRISGLLGDRRMSALGLALLALGLGMTPLWEVLPFLLVCLTLAAVGRALTQPGGLALMASLGRSEDEGGRLMGLAQSATSMGRVLGPAIGGVAFDADPRAPFVLSGVLLAVMGVWWARAARERVAI